MLSNPGLASAQALPPGTNLVGYTNPGEVQQALMGNVQIGDTGHLSLSVAGDVRLLFTNPAGSGKNAIIFKLAGTATATAPGVSFISTLQPAYLQLLVHL